MWMTVKMKKNFILVSCLGLFSTGVFAQSSVTIYGVIDAGITASKQLNYDWNAEILRNQWRTGVDSGNLSASRIGIKGVEDLGGGTSAIFNLEAGFSVDDGTSGDAYSDALFSRRAVVGLRNNAYGEITLGRQDSVFSDTMKQIDPFGDREQYSDASFIIYDSQLNNALVYTTPDWDGAYAKFNYAFGENPGSVKRGSFYGASLNYEANNLNLIFAYGHSDYANNPNATSISTLVGSLATSGAYNYYWGWLDGYYPSSRNQYMLAASYDFGIVKPFIIASASKTNTQLMSPWINYFKEKTAKAGVTIPLGASNVMAAIGYAKNNKSNTPVHRYAFDYTLGYTYEFSKRTTFYTMVDIIKNKHMLLEPLYVTQHLGTTEFNIGIRHRF